MQTVRIYTGDSGESPIEDIDCGDDPNGFKSITRWASTHANVNQPARGSSP